MKEKKESVYQRSTKLVRLDIGWHELIKRRAKQGGKSIREVLESALADYLGASK